MNYTVTVDTLPQFMMQLGFLLSTQDKVEYTIWWQMDDADLVEQWRTENPNRSDKVRTNLAQNPTRWSHLVTLS